MEKFNLEVPAVPVAIESRGVTVSLDLAAIPHDVLRLVLVHGIKQKVADAASGATGAIWAEVKGKDAPKPSKDQLADFVETHDKAIKDQTLALMQKAADALLAGQWQVRVAGDGTSTKWTEEQSLALDIAKGTLQGIFAAALAKAAPGTKATASAFVALDPKVAAFFKANDKRPTWNDAAVMDWIKRQLEAKTPRDIMAEAREELARREAASAGMADDLGELLGDL